MWSYYGRLFGILLLLMLQNVCSQLIWYDNVPKDNKSINVPMVNIHTDTQKDNHTSVMKQQNKKRTLDENCELRFGLHIGYQAYTPYVNMGM